MARPHFLALLSKLEIRGDDSLLRLAQSSYEAAGLGGEVYPNDPDDLAHLMRFLPRGTATAHLPRHLNLTEPLDREAVLAFVERAQGRLYGFVVHDHAVFAQRKAELRIAFEELDHRLAALPGQPFVFVEFSAALSPDEYVEVIHTADSTNRGSACIDIGHVGIRACAEAYQAATRANVFDLEPDSAQLPEALEPLEAAVATALPTVLDLVRRIGALRKPFHMHLHDGHPLSRISHYRVSDHLSFLDRIPIEFEHRGQRQLRTLFGPSGLRAIVAEALRAVPPERLSFMLEIHPREGRSPLRRWAPLFAHWSDLTNAERMNYWMERILSNAVLLEDACAATSAPVPS